MSIEKLYPFAGIHSVQNAIFVVEWTEPLKLEMIQSFSKLHAKYKNLGLPHIQHQQHFEVKIDNSSGVPGAATTKSASSPSAVVFARSDSADQVVRSVTLSRSHCMIAVPDYTRWDVVFADVLKYIKIALDELHSQRPISAISLQYNDMFGWKDEPASLELREIFSANQFIPENIFRQSGLWHLHQGYMTDEQAPLPHRLLENINVDMLDTSGERVIQIVGAHRAILKSPLWQANLKNRDTLLDVFESLHAANKRMLQRLLTPAVRDRINLVEG